MLILVATPIGNLKDITFRAIEALKDAHYILCEDTRRSLILLRHYGIEKPLRSYHQFNEARREEEIIADLKQGMQIALITDAGTPGISDPGERLVKRCRAESLPVTTLPGPCAAIAALTLTGFAMERFQFLGFLPKKPSALRRTLKEAESYPGVSIFYESPFRVCKTLKLMEHCRVAIVRELTKIHEDCRIGSPAELLAHFEQKPPKGECVILVEPLYREGFKNWDAPRRRPGFESSEAGAETAKLKKFSDAGGFQTQRRPDAGRTDF